VARLDAQVEPEIAKSRAAREVAWQRAPAALKSRITEGFGCVRGGGGSADTAHTGQADRMMHPSTPVGRPWGGLARECDLTFELTRYHLRVMIIMIGTLD
jgi:hypothetical protein